MKRIVAGIITLTVLAGVLWLARGQPRRDDRVTATPVKCIERMFSAAARGDVAGYIACFTGNERDRIRRSLEQASATTVEDSLRSTVRELKSWVVLDPPVDPNRLVACSLAVERIYASRVERQQLDLRRDGKEWKISQAHAAQPYQPPIAYGTPVYDVEESPPTK